jgi:hypothetical protein
VPRYWKSKDSARLGYSPICGNEWRKGICNKPCRTCPNASYVPLSATLLLEHFRGERILGCYPLLDDNTLNFIACDLDNHGANRDPLADLCRLADVCTLQEVPLHALRSKSGNGYHAYLFFNSPVPAWKARLGFFALLQESQVIGDDAELSSFDKLIPDQDTLDGKRFGNLVALPFQGQAAREGHTLFLDPIEFKTPIQNQWEHLQGLRRWTEAALNSLIEEWNLQQTKPASKKSQKGKGDNWITHALAGVTEGSRDDTGIKLAGYFRRKKLPEDVTLQILKFWNERNRPPLEAHEIEKIVNSANRYHEYGDPQDESERIGVSFVGSEESS